MGYYLQAFICRHSDSDRLTTAFDKAVPVLIGQGLSLIPMTEELFDQINSFKVSSAISSFTYLTVNIEEKILDVIDHRPFSYVEAEYHGGQGGQIAIIWKDKTRHQLLDFGENRINQVLRYFGVTANKGQDEFLTMGLGLRRHTSEWLEERK